MWELPTPKILVQVLAAEEHLVDIAGAWDVPGGGAYLFQFSAFRKHTMKIYGTMQVASCHVEARKISRDIPDIRIDMIKFRCRSTKCFLAIFHFPLDFALGSNDRRLLAFGFLSQIT